MAKQTINQGTAPTGAGGDTFRSGSAKLQANDDEIYAQLGANAQGVLPVALPIANGGTGATTKENAVANLGLSNVLKSNVPSVLTKPISGGGAFTNSIGHSSNAAYLSYSSGQGAPSKVGTLALRFETIPVTALPVLVIRGFSTGFGAWKITIAFYGLNRLSTSMQQAFLEGSIPSEHLRIAYDKSGRLTILLGTANTTWTYTSVILEDAFSLYGGDNVNNSYLNSASFLYYNEQQELDAGFISPATVTYIRLRTTANTTIDANGFLKNASPIVQLFADKIELNDEAQQQNIEFEKLDVGNYLIKGSSGFAQDGWYIETPKDANGNLLVAVVYGQLENGDISVKTYDYMLNKKGRIIADTETPLDIPETRWIDLRLQELPQPEIEVTDDPEQ